MSDLPIDIFVHIPKTAGTTLTGIIARQYPSDRTLAHYSVTESIDEMLDRVAEHDRTQLRLLQGHFPFGVHQYLQRPYRYFTFLRAPVSRTLSLYSYARSNPYHWLHDTIMQDNLRISDCIARQLSKGFDNVMVRQISGAGYEPDFGKCTFDMLEAAKYNLKSQFVVTGFTERFDQSLILLGERLGWRKLNYVRRNITSNRVTTESIDQATLDLISGHNFLDQQLFDWALAEFDLYYENHSHQLDRKVIAFQASNLGFKYVYRFYERTIKRYRAAQQ